MDLKCLLDALESLKIKYENTQKDIQIALSEKETLFKQIQVSHSVNLQYQSDISDENLSML